MCAFIIIFSILLFGCTGLLVSKLNFSISCHASAALENDVGEQLEFNYNNLVFNYKLNKHIKKHPRFDINYEINKYNRFGTHKDRQALLQHLIEVGLDKSIALNYIFPDLNKTIENIKDTIRVKPKDASVKVNTNSEKVFFITPEVVGIELDENALYNTIYNAYINNLQLKFKIPINKFYPQITAQNLGKDKFLRADFSTDYSSSSTDRKHNIKNALTTLNMVKIAPNQIFSFNNTVGRRSKDNGYREAKIIVNNEYVDGLGGGVCQVSTTLYNSALLSGLEIVEANKHSRQVGYVKYGFDAMVNFGSSDLKFKNNTSEDITIVTNYNAGKARIRIFGESLMGKSYRLTNEIVSTTPPGEEILKDENNEYTNKVCYEDEFFILKPGHAGMEVKSYRECYLNGQLIDKQLLRFDKFKPQNTVKMYGNQKRVKPICYFPLDFNYNLPA